MSDETQSHFEQRVYREYFDSLVRLANARIGDQHRRDADGEDIAISALASFFDRYGDQSRWKLEDPQSLWAIVATIAHRKALNHVRKNTQLKRGLGKTRGDSVFGSEAQGLNMTPAPEAPPNELVASIETVQSLLAELPEELAFIAVRKLEGFTNAEISQQLDCSVATVERRLKMIRSQWESATEPS